MRGMNPHYNHVKLHSFLPYYIRAFASFCEVLPSLKSECSRGSVLVVDYSMGISFLPMIPLKGTWEIPKMISKIVFDGQNTATLKKYTVYTVYIIYHTVNVLWYIYPWCILCIYMMHHIHMNLLTLRFYNIWHVVSFSILVSLLFY